LNSCSIKHLHDIKQTISPNAEQNKSIQFTLALGLSDDLSEARDATEELRDIPLSPTFSDALEAELPGCADQVFVGSTVDPTLPDKTASEGSFSEILHDLLFFTSNECH
jgi:hypothetical protein